MPILRGHGSDVNTAVIEPKNMLLLTASKDSTARIWGRNGNLMAVLRGHQDEVRSAIFANDDAYVLTASRDNFLRVWHWADSLLIDSVQLSEHPHRIAMSTDGRYVMVNLEENEPLLLSFSNGKLQPHVKNEGQINKISWHPYMKDEASLPPSGKKGNNVVFSNDGRLVAVMSNYSVQILNLKGDVIAEYKNEKGFFDVSFSPDNQYFIVAFGNESAIFPLPRTIHKWLTTNGFPKVESIK